MLDKVVNILIEGRKHGYARSGSYVLNDKGEKEFSFGGYRDSYSDGVIEIDGENWDVFSGREVVTVDGKAVLVVNYRGRALVKFRKKAYDFLKALMNRALEEGLYTRIPDRGGIDLDFPG